jgi:hypothetical protein
VNKETLKAMNALIDVATIRNIVMSQNCTRGGMSLSEGVQAMSNRIMELEMENRILNTMLNR